MSILIGYDDTAYGHDALILGLQLAGTTGQSPTVVTVYPDDERGLMVAMQDHAWRDSVRQVADRKLETARALVGDRSDVRFEAVGLASAAHGLHEYAERLDASLLVVGSSANAV